MRIKAAVLVFLCGVWSCVSANSGVTKYLIYTVKSGIKYIRVVQLSPCRGEGFNLRRDVHMRAAALVRLLQKQSVGGTSDWVLVLPPWPRMYHWRSASHDSANFIPWGHFFDLPSLNQFVPTIEFDEYLERNGHTIDEVMVLQNFKGEFTVDDFGKIEEQPCLSEQHRYKHVSGEWKGRMFGVKDLSIKTHRCMSAMGFVSLILPYLHQLMGNSVLVENFEILLHEKFGDINYWQSRYSMVYAGHLREAGNRFMSETLGYTPNEGGTGRELAKDSGGKYISVHLRRQDYLYAHKDVVPSLEGAASQLNTLKRELRLETVFLASDASLDEKRRLQGMVTGLVWYTSSDEEQRNYGDGGVAIIDQWVAAHAQHFLGTPHSTFSFRIREDRQFLGFSKESTFNDVCSPSDNEHDPHSCEKPTYWKWEGGPPTPPKTTPADHVEL